MSRGIFRRGFFLLAVAALGHAATSASAQVVNPPSVPNAGNSQAQLSQQQFQDMATLRYLQSRRRGQVRTGVPQFIPFGPQAIMPPGNMQMDAQAGDTDRKSSTQKRIEARKVREEQKKAAREEALAKKAKNGKPDKKDAAKAKKAKPNKKDNAKAKKAKADLAKKKAT
jgi:hypothetical protein